MDDGARAADSYMPGDDGDALAGELAHSAAEVLRVCAARAAERIVILADETTAASILTAFASAVTALGAADPVTLMTRPRQPAFADLPSPALAALLAADLALDLTTTPWLYSDSFTRFTQECGASGTRLALIWGTAESARTIAACPPSPLLTARCRRVLAALEEARAISVRSPHGMDFAAELGAPGAYPRAFIGEPPARPGTIGAPLCASVTAAFVPGTARGTIGFHGAGRFQGPRNVALRAAAPVPIRVEAGRVVAVGGDDAAAVALRDWFAQAGPDGEAIMDCNIGCDPRADLRWADNSVVHSYAGGVMIGIGNPYQYRREGSYRPGYHLDLMSPGVAVDLDERPFLRGGHFVPESGVE